MRIFTALYLVKHGHYTAFQITGLKQGIMAFIPAIQKCFQ